MPAEIHGAAGRQLWHVALILALSLCALPAGALEKREVPDYDGRSSPSPEVADSGDVGLWVPRVLFFPLYLVSEYAVRVPLGALISHAERHDWPRRIYDTLTFGERHQAGVYPVGFVDFGFRPSAGVRFFWNDAFAKGNGLRAGVAYGGNDWLLATISDRYHLEEARSVGLRLTYQRRPDYLFYGLGPRSEDDAESRYGLQRLEVLAALEQRFGGRPDSDAASAPILGIPGGSLEQRSGDRPNGVWLSGGVRSVRFRDDTCCRNPSVVRQVEAGAFPELPGLGERFTAPVVRADLLLDSRRARPERRTGALLRLYGESTFRSREGENAGWLRYGGHAEGFLDLAWEARVVSLALDAEMVDPLGTVPVPFFELAGPTGAARLAAFRPGRLMDRSAAALSLRYSWPVWAALDGQLTFGAGNVFGEHLEGFTPDLLRLSAALGISSADVGPWIPPVEVLIGVGSEPLERGLRFSSFRLALRAAL